LAASIAASTASSSHPPNVSATTALSGGYTYVSAVVAVAVAAAAAASPDPPPAKTVPAVVQPQPVLAVAAKQPPLTQPTFQTPAPMSLKAANAVTQTSTGVAVQNGENVPYFHGALSDEQTDLLLKKEGAGAFLVRNNAAQNCLILSYVNNSNAVTHLRLWRQPDGRYCLRNPPSASDSMHQSVDAFVQSKQKTFTKPILIK